MTVELMDRSMLAAPGDAVEFITNILQASTEYSIIGKNLDGDILLWKGAHRLYGYAPEEVVGKANSSILHNPEDIAAGKPPEIMGIALRKGKWEGTFQRVQESGERSFASPNGPCCRCRRAPG